MPAGDGKHTFKRVQCFAGDRNLSGDLNQVALQAPVELQEFTTIGDLSRVRKPGLEDVSAEGSGFWSEQADADRFAARGSEVEGPFIIERPGNADGNLAYGFDHVQGDYSQGGQVGDPRTFNFNLQGRQGRLVRGLRLFGGTQTTVGEVTYPGFDLGETIAAGSGKKLYVAVSAWDVGGTTPTLDIVVESDITGFPTPVTRDTVPQITGLAGVWREISGLTVDPDTFYRIKATLGGTASPFFSFYVLVAIL